MTTPTPNSEFQSPDSQVYLSFGGGLRLFSEDYFIEELSSLGVTRKGFRSLCRALQVPLIYVGTSALVDLVSFQLAMKAISRVGQKDFYVPGCRPLKNNHKRGVRELNQAYYTREWKNILAELLASRQVHGLATSKEISALTKNAAKRLTEMAIHLQVSSLQAAHERQSLKVLEQSLDSPKETAPDFSDNPPTDLAP
tara:strand:+ start:338 stop:928 length:591 start_codon:yes stop_codon:yes gene_type:complete